MTKEEKAAAKAEKEAAKIAEAEAVAKAEEVAAADAIKAIPEAPQGSRKARWEAFCEAHKRQNPVKYAERLANGEMEMPESFA